MFSVEGDLLLEADRHFSKRHSLYTEFECIELVRRQVRTKVLSELELSKTVRASHCCRCEFLVDAYKIDRQSLEACHVFETNCV